MRVFDKAYQNMKDTWPPYKECPQCQTINPSDVESCKQCGEGLTPFRALSLPMKIAIVVAWLVIAFIVLVQYVPLMTSQH